MADTKRIINCPACGAEMTKVFIKDKGFYLDICTEGCGGILFDNREFKHFDEPHKNIDEITEALKNKTFEKQDESKKRICPVCHAPMVKNFASSLKEVQIDECYSCGAKFLDYGELDKIREQFKTEKDRQEKFNKDFLKEFGDLLPDESNKDGKGKNFISNICEKLFK